MEYDLIIRGGAVYDGSGGRPFVADVAVKHGLIAAIGNVRGNATTLIDASGKMVTPGFIDIHTHYDGQATWEDRLSPSSDHGVTTVVTGNCGVGFAPCRPHDRDGLVGLMAGVEDIPEVVMAEGLAWNWETFPEYLQAIADRPHDVDIAAMIPHSALRVYVMGQRALDREEATAEDVEQMAAIVREAMKAGAVGLGTSRAVQQKGINGEVIPSSGADERELRGLLEPVAEAGGVFQLLSDFDLFRDIEGEFEMFRRLVRKTGVSMSFTVFQKHKDPDGWRRLMTLADEACADGLPIRPQVLGRPTGLLLGLRLTMSPFDDAPTFAALKHLPIDEKLCELRRPEMRSAILEEVAALGAERFDHMFELGENVDYEPEPSASVTAKAAQAGTPPEAYAFDLLMANNGRGIIFDPIQNFAGGSLDAPYEMMLNENALLGGGDGGAHYGLICDASYPTTMLAYWTRDRTRGPRLPLPAVVRMLTSAGAEVVGLHDRGRIEVGKRADLNVIDYDRLRLHAPETIYDLPAGGRRIVQRADGYIATIVAGVVTYRGGVSSGELPGQVVRGPQRPSKQLESA